VSESDDLRHSPIESAHVELDAKLVPFGGWNMPLSYPSGTLHEHRACRTDAVVFDVSHLGTVRVRGANAFAALQAAFTNDLGRIEVGKAQYTHLLDEHDASVLDDIIVWWRVHHKAAFTRLPATTHQLCMHQHLSSPYIILVSPQYTAQQSPPVVPQRADHIHSSFAILVLMRVASDGSHLRSAPVVQPLLYCSCQAPAHSTRIN
jgi:hypothetical protein